MRSYLSKSGDFSVAVIEFMIANQAKVVAHQVHDLKDGVAFEHAGDWGA